MVKGILEEGCINTRLIDLLKACHAEAQARPELSKGSMRVGPLRAHFKNLSVTPSLYPLFPALNRTEKIIQQVLWIY
jgi:hypothetical protein